MILYVRDSVLFGASQFGISNSKIRNSALRVVQGVTSVCQLTGSQQRCIYWPSYTESRYFPSVACPGRTL